MLGAVDGALDKGRIWDFALVLPTVRYITLAKSFSLSGLQYSHLQSKVLLNQLSLFWSVYGIIRIIEVENPKRMWTHVLRHTHMGGHLLIQHTFIESKY